MGFSSYHCVGCGAPLVSHWGFDDYKRLPKKVKFLQRAVRVFEDGRTIRGEYTGYSALNTSMGEHFIDFEQEPCMYHEECWVNLGKPTEYVPSAMAECQGYFFNGAELSKAKPARG